MPRKGKSSRDTASEGALEKRLVKAVKKAGGTCIKLPPSWYKGIPDRLVLLPFGRVYFIELKRFKKKANKDQRRWIIILRNLGFRAGVVAGSEAVTRFINDQIGNSRIRSS